MTDAGGYVEIQGTAEARPFDRAQLDAMLDLAAKGIERLFVAQRTALDAVPGRAG
jgi:ribonuclease PH